MKFKAHHELITCALKVALYNIVSIAISMAASTCIHARAMLNRLVGTLHGLCMHGMSSGLHEL